jgi:glycerophosphoryl diester phosphodiesterase
MAKIVGHRGAAGYAPENTILSFKTAIDVGCDETELDVRLSKDSKVVVIHDEEVSRVTGREGFVCDMTLAELKKLNCPEKHKIPTLQEVIDFCKGKIDLLIELKVPGTPEKVNRIILKNKIMGNVAVISFHYELLREIKKLNPKLRAGLLFEKCSEEIWKLAEEIPIDFIGPRKDIVTKGIVDRAHKMGKTVYAYHVNDENTGKDFLSLGVDEIGTDFPKLFRSDLKTSGLWRK